MIACTLEQIIPLEPKTARSLLAEIYHSLHLMTAHLTCSREAAGLCRRLLDLPSKLPNLTKCSNQGHQVLTTFGT